MFFKDEYHVFFQYSPDNANGGDKYWGHYVSKELVDFKFVGSVIAPDTKLDKNGAYSGSAFIKDGTMYVYYTGNVKLPGEHDIDRAYSGRKANTILIKSKDGRIFDEKKLLMDNKDYPEVYTCHVRDPKVGGAPANVCGVFAKMGDKGCLISKLGKDPFADKILEEFENYNISCEYIKQTDEANTSLSFVSLKNDGDREFSFFRNPGADMLLSEDEIEDALYRYIKFSNKYSVASVMKYGAIASYPGREILE